MQTILGQLKLKKQSKVTVLCVGSCLRGDDIAGILVARQLLRFVKKSRLQKKVQIVVGETAPENFTGEIRKFNPDFILFIDSADFGKKPGDFFVLKPEQITGATFCTHKMPLSIMVDYLRGSLKAQVVVVGIQPKVTGFGKPVSREVKRAAGRISQALEAVLKNKS